MRIRAYASNHPAKPTIFSHKTRTRGEAVRERDKAVREGDEAVSAGDKVGRRRRRERNEAEVVSAGNVQASVRSEEQVSDVVALTLTCSNESLNNS
ncbi:hypothetical protein MA16_Dca010293 [Dendrobium catenatum]|uniref:Uncharacterized protein n=1 Tax=Dendrobium catenatum TaxID=906689 RepID=A0A2I0W3D1_9ASPA|nr:hypothetical protein MA16_Dca010293 [Dendrobium catenatum]